MLTEKQLLDAPKEHYMNDDQLAFFKNLLEAQIDEIVSNLESAQKKLKEQQYQADELDKAAAEEDMRTRLRFLDRQSKLLPKLREAIWRIEREEYGYCEVTGEPIGLRRLLARPTATLCAEEKTRQEQQEKNFRKS
jgi:DnaK suppressor protein